MLLALVLGACTPPAPAVADPAPGDEYGALERELFRRVSRHRDSVELPRLRYDERLADIARQHSHAMASGAVPFGHEGFQQRAALALGVGYPWLGENVAFNGYNEASTVDVAVVGLIGSPPHRHTMEGDWQHSGVGVARSPGGTWFYTQLFAR